MPSPIRLRQSLTSLLIALSLPGLVLGCANTLAPSGSQAGLSSAYQGQGTVEGRLLVPPGSQLVSLTGNPFGIAAWLLGQPANAHDFDREIKVKVKDRHDKKEKEIKIKAREQQERLRNDIRVLVSGRPARLEILEIDTDAAGNLIVTFRLHDVSAGRNRIIEFIPASGTFRFSILVPEIQVNTVTILPRPVDEDSTAIALIVREADARNRIELATLTPEQLQLLIGRPEVERVRLKIHTTVRHHHVIHVDLRDLPEIAAELDQAILVLPPGPPLHSNSRLLTIEAEDEDDDNPGKGKRRGKDRD